MFSFETQAVKKRGGANEEVTKMLSDMREVRPRKDLGF